MRAALVNIQSGKVENVIELPDDYDPEVEGAYLPPDGFKIEQDDQLEADIGGVFNDGVWEKSQPVEMVTQPSVQDQLDALTELLVTKGTITEAEIIEIKAPEVPELEAIK